MVARVSRVRRRTHRVRRDRLTWREEAFLLMGPSVHQGSPFPSETAARAAWRQFADQVVQRAAAGHVPWAAVAFDRAQGISEPDPYSGLRLVRP